MSAKTASRAPTLAQLRAWPKAELHCHLDGSLRVRTALELGRAAGVKLPADDEAGLALSFNTDDRGVFGITLSAEYAAALEAGFTLSELREAALAAPEQLFLPQPRRRRLAAAFRKGLEALDGC